MSNHKIKYWVYAGSELVRHSRQMVGFKGWEASCSCGWKTRSGGALQSWIKREVQWHKWEHNVGGDCQISSQMIDRLHAAKLVDFNTT